MSDHDIRELKLEILKFTHKAGLTAKDILETAEQYVEFVLGGKSTEIQLTQHKASTKKK